MRCVVKNHHSTVSNETKIPLKRGVFLFLEIIVVQLPWLAEVLNGGGRSSFCWGFHWGGFNWGDWFWGWG
jgi:hypothetical protein